MEFYTPMILIVVRWSSLHHPFAIEEKTSSKGTPVVTWVVNMGVAPKTRMTMLFLQIPWPRRLVHFPKSMMIRTQVLLSHPVLL